MRITPLDIRKQEFRKAMRGLDSEEVYAFLSTVAEEYEAALSDNKALRERVLELDDKVQEYRNLERTLRDTLLTAERVTADAKENARREADLIIKEAQIEAEKILRDIKTHAMNLRQEVQELRRERDNYLTRMKMLAESYLKFIEGEERDFEIPDRTAPPALEEEALKMEIVEKKDRPANPQPKPVQPELVTQPVTDTSTDKTDPQPATPLTPFEPARTGLERASARETGADQMPGTSIPDLNAILDRMVAGQQDMLKSDDSGESLADPPEADETQLEPAPALPQINGKDPAAPAAKIGSPSPKPQAAPATENGKEDEWSLDKIKQDILANSPSTE